MLPSFRSGHHNPLYNIKLLARHDPTKACTYAASLSQIITSIIPPLSSSSDVTALDPKVSCCPTTAFILQATSLESIAFQRMIAKVHNAKARNLWEYFIPHMQTFTRRTHNIDPSKRRERYSLLKDVSKRLLGILGEQELPFDVMRHLSSCAIEANLVQECTTWTQEWMNALYSRGSSSDAALIAMCKVRLATLELHRWKLTSPDPKTPEDLEITVLEKKIQDATSGMDSVSKGRKPDLVVFLQEVGLLRRNVLVLLTGLPDDTIKRLFKTDDTDILDPLKDRLRTLGEEATRSVVLFCRKYMGMGLSGTESVKIKSIITPAMDAILMACWRNFDLSQADAWDHTESLVKDCWSAMKACESELAEEGASFFEKVSNVYWRIHLIYRSKPGHDQYAVRALRRSIATMDGRPVTEIANAQIAKKWERLGTIFITAARDYTKAEEAFAACLDVAARTGLLNEIGNLASATETVQTLSINPEYSWLGRVLSSLIKIAIKRKDDSAEALGFHYKGLSIAARGILLEWSFHLALDDVTDGGSVLRAIGERLIDVYELEDMPIRRTRVIASLTALTVDQSGLLDIEYVQSLGEDVLDYAATTDSFNTQLEEDSQLVLQRDDLIARCQIGLALCYWKQGKPRRELATQALTLWAAILAKGGWNHCIERVGDVEGLRRRLEMMSEFFEMKGEVELQISTLDVLLRIREIQPALDYDGRSP